MTDATPTKAGNTGKDTDFLVSHAPVVFVCSLLASTAPAVIDPSQYGEFANNAHAIVSASGMLWITALCAFLVMLLFPSPPTKSLYFAAGLGVIGSALVCHLATQITLSLFIATFFSVSVPFWSLVIRRIESSKGGASSPKT